MGEMGNPFFLDITEIEGFDNLHHAEGILLEAQKRAAGIFRSEETHYLINGSTCGVLAAVSGCVPFGGRILMARNCHKSAYHGVMLSGLRTDYLYPQFSEEAGINGPILASDVENALERLPDVSAVLITSPTYDGVASDVKAIGEAAHRRGIPLIVDEAHGAHFPFSDGFPEDSVSCGADVVIHSLHKTLPSLTQTALIHLNGDRIDRERIRRFLTVYQSSSPSYVLMSSIETCLEWADGHREEFDRFCGRVRVLRERLRSMKRLKLLHAPGMEMDPSKLLIGTAGAGMSGGELSGLLRREYHIELEMACPDYVCAIVTVADTEKELSRLGAALLEIDSRSEAGKVAGRRRSGASDGSATSAGRAAEQETAGRGQDYGQPAPTDEDPAKGRAAPPGQVFPIREAQERPYEWTPLSQAAGRVSQDFVTPYPPGIPLLAPGERITSALAWQILDCADMGLEIHGVKERRIKVLRGREDA